MHLSQPRLLRLGLALFCAIAVLLALLGRMAGANSGRVRAQPSAPNDAAAATPVRPTVHVAITGADGVSQSGSVTQPWRTLHYAVDHVPAGGTIHMHSGSHAGARIGRPGMVSAPLTLQAAPCASVVITGPGPNDRHDSNLELETWADDGVVAHWVIDMDAAHQFARKHLRSVR